MAPTSSTAAGPARRIHPLLELAFLALVALVLAFVLKTFVAQAYSIPSASMEPQLHIGDRVVVSKLAYDLHDPNRGDIVVFDNPEAPPEQDDSWLPVRIGRNVLEGIGLVSPANDVLIKRVIGLPGETLEGRDGNVYIDGRRLVEPYLPAGARTPDFGPVTVPAGRLWLMGDNRTNSRDSKFFGPVAASTVVGRAILKVWPPGDASFL